MATWLRLAIIVLMAVPCLAPPAHATIGKDQLGNGDVTAIGVHGSSGTYLAWTPTAGARFYTVYRGPAPDQLRPIADVQINAYEDSAAPGVSSYYGIGVNGHAPPTTFSVQGEGCVSFMMSPPSVNTHLDSCIGP